MGVGGGGGTGGKLELELLVFGIGHPQKVVVMETPSEAYSVVFGEGREEREVGA